MQSGLTELNITNKPEFANWFTLVCNRLAWRQLIGAVRTYAIPSQDLVWQPLNDLVALRLQVSGKHMYIRRKCIGVA